MKFEHCRSRIITSESVNQKNLPESLSISDYIEKEMALEAVASIGTCDLILRTIRPFISSAHKIPQQDVLFYSPNDTDEIAQLAMRAVPLPGPPREPKQVSLYATRWFCQSITTPTKEAEWQHRLNFILHLCTDNDIYRVVIVQPSVSLCAGFVTAGIRALCACLESMQTVLRITVVLNAPLYDRALAELVDIGYCTPLVGNAHISEISLLQQSLSVLRCQICKRLLNRPTLPVNEKSLVCKLCCSHAENPLLFDQPLISRLINCIKVTCRCGEATTANDQDRHTVNCATKEFFCNEHRFNGASQEFFTHLLEEHYPFVKDKAPSYLNRD